MLMYSVDIMRFDHLCDIVEQGYLFNFQFNLAVVFPHIYIMSVGWD